MKIGKKKKKHGSKGRDRGKGDSDNRELKRRLRTFISIRKGRHIVIFNSAS